MSIDQASGIIPRSASWGLYETRETSKRQSAPPKPYSSDTSCGEKHCSQNAINVSDFFSKFMRVCYPAAVAPPGLPSQGQKMHGTSMAPCRDGGA